MSSNISRNDFNFTKFIKELLFVDSCAWFEGDIIKFILIFGDIAPKKLYSFNFSKKDEENFFKIVKRIKIRVSGNFPCEFDEKIYNIMNAIPSLKYDNGLEYQIGTVNCPQDGAVLWNRGFYKLCLADRCHNPSFKSLSSGDVKHILYGDETAPKNEEKLNDMTIIEKIEYFYNRRLNTNHKVYIDGNRKTDYVYCDIGSIEIRGTDEKDALTKLYETVSMKS